MAAVALVVVLVLVGVAGTAYFLLGQIGKPSARFSPLVAAPAKPVPIKPAPLTDERTILSLPSPVADVVVGGGGRFLILHLPKLRQLAVFDGEPGPKCVVETRFVLVPAAIAVPIQRLEMIGSRSRKRVLLRRDVEIAFQIRIVVVLFVQRVAAKIVRGDMGQIVPAQIGDRQLAEDVVDDRGRHLDVRVALHHAVRLEAREEKRIDELVERHAML